MSESKYFESKQLSESIKSAAFAYLKKEFDKYSEDTYSLQSIVSCESYTYIIKTDDDGGPENRLYFANGSFCTKLINTEYIKILTIKPDYKYKFTFDFLVLYLTVYANHYINKIDDSLNKLNIFEDANDTYYDIYKHINIPYFTIEEQKAIIKMYKTITDIGLNIPSDSDTESD